MVIHFGIVALAALGLQLFVIYAPLGSGDTLRRVVFVFSYLLLAGFVLANLRRPGLLVIGLGLLLNFLAIASNGGFMPVSPDTLERSGQRLTDISVGEWVPHSKDVLLARQDTHLSFLTDTLVLKNPFGLRVFSIGDVIIGAGLVITLGELFLPRVQRVSRDRASLT